MFNSGRVCPSCGSRLSKSDTTCPLCGFETASDHDASAASSEPALPAAAAVYENLPPPPHGEEATRASDHNTDDAEKAVSVRSGNGPIVLLAGLLLVVGLYLISSISGSTAPELETQPVPASSQVIEDDTVEPLEATVVEQVAAFREEAEKLSGTARLDKLRELAVLYQEQGRFDLAGDTQIDIAGESGMEIDWVRAGNLYYDWMETRQAAVKVAYARKAISAYQEALAINPDNLDVRTDMAVAYLFDPENPMQAIINTNQVLSADSTHLQANFNRGIMLMQINRMEDALQQFRKVLRLAPDPNHPVHQRAAEAVRIIESRRGPDE